MESDTTVLILANSSVNESPKCQPAISSFNIAIEFYYLRLFALSPSYADVIIRCPKSSFMLANMAMRPHAVYLDLDIPELKGFLG